MSIRKIDAVFCDSQDCNKVYVLEKAREDTPYITIEIRSGSTRNKPGILHACAHGECLANVFEAHMTDISRIIIQK